MTFAEITKANYNRVAKLKLFGATSEEEFNRNLMNLGYTPASASEFKQVSNATYCHVSDVDKYKDLMRQYNERVTLHVRRDKTGDKFVRGMFYYILENQSKPFDMEYFYMRSGFTAQMIADTPKLQKGLELAWEDIRKHYGENVKPNMFS